MKEIESLKIENNCLNIALSGEIDSANVNEFYGTVYAEYKKSPLPVVFDMEKLEFIDSTTLGTFVKILKLVKTDGNTLKLVKVPTKIKKLFLICSLDTVMEIE